MRFSRAIITTLITQALFFTVGPQLAFAQADISAQVLLGTSQNEKPLEAGLESGRYQTSAPSTETGDVVDSVDRDPAQDDMQIRLKKSNQKTATATTLPKKKPVAKLPAKRVQNQQLQDSSQMQTSVVVNSPLKPAPVQKDSSLAQSLFSPTATPRPSIIPPTTSSTTTTSSTSTSTTLPSSTTTMPEAVIAQPNIQPEAPVVSAKIETPAAAVASQPEAILEEPAVFDQPALEAYKERIHSDDVRLNQIEVTVLPGVLNTESKADYSYRNYNSFSPDVQFGAQFWMSPFLGVYGNYMTSLGADIVSSGAQNSRTPAKHEFTEIGVDIRKFFGMSRRAKSIEFGVLYSEYKFSVPGDEVNRVDTKTAGFGFHFSTRIPTAPSYAWTLGTKISPRITHSEKATGLDLQSGSSPESSRIGFDLGGEFKMSRENQVIWNLNLSFEKNQYVGPANLPDQNTGITPNGVSVRNTFTGFSLGYRWGQ